MASSEPFREWLLRLHADKQGARVFLDRVGLATRTRAALVRDLDTLGISRGTKDEILELHRRWKLGTHVVQRPKTEDEILATYRNWLTEQEDRSKRDDAIGWYARLWTKVTPGKISSPQGIEKKLRELLAELESDPERQSEVTAEHLRMALEVHPRALEEYHAAQKAAGESAQPPGGTVTPFPAQPPPGPDAPPSVQLGPVQGAGQPAAAEPTQRIMAQAPGNGVHETWDGKSYVQSSFTAGSLGIAKPEQPIDLSNGWALARRFNALEARLDYITATVNQMLSAVAQLVAASQARAAAMPSAATGPLWQAMPLSGAGIEQARADLAAMSPEDMQRAALEYAARVYAVRAHVNAATADLSQLPVDGTVLERMRAVDWTRLIRAHPEAAASMPWDKITDLADLGAEQEA